jgi:hypothetical protein
VLYDDGNDKQQGCYANKRQLPLQAMLVVMMFMMMFVFTMICHIFTRFYYFWVQRYGKSRATRLQSGE